MVLRDETWVRAARELLRWDQTRLAQEAGLTLVTVRRYESGRSQMADETVQVIRRTLEANGIVFLDPEATSGAKVVAAIGLRTSAIPDPRPDKRVYKYKSLIRGRPPRKRAEEGKD